MEREIVRLSIEPVTASGYRSSWFKLVERVNSRKDGFAFEGDFLPCNKEIELPVGAIVIEKEPTGSVNNGGHDANIWRVTKDNEGTERSDHLEYVTHFDWHKEFLTFRDTVAALVNPVVENEDEDEADGPHPLADLFDKVAALVAEHGEADVLAAVAAAVAAAAAAKNND